MEDEKKVIMEAVENTAYKTEITGKAKTEDTPDSERREEKQDCSPEAGLYGMTEAAALSPEELTNPAFGETAVKKGNIFRTADGWRDWVKDVVWVVSRAAILAAVTLIFFKPTVVQQHSMEDTFYSGHCLLLSRQAYTLFGEPERGDIVVFESSLTDSKGRMQPLIKRVIGLPGETISISGGVVYIDGEPLEENYLKDGYTASEMDPYTIPEGYLFCMGDNRQNSMDSRSASIGPVPIENIIGKAVLRMLPLKQFGGLYKDLSY